MRVAGAFATLSDHPSLPGHFPGNPVVPGVILLDRALRLVAEALGWGEPVRLAAVKFLRPVLPDESVQVFCREIAAGTAEIECCVGGKTALRATARFART